MQIGGEYDKTKSGFKNLAMVMLISTAAILSRPAISIQECHQASAGFGRCSLRHDGGVLLRLWIMGEPFGFMAFLGVASLIGVIVSHSIVLFDFIEERHAEGDDFELALIDAGILRLRPVLITVGATVLALLPLALHGGPLWKPLCYAQIGGLLVATVVTKLQVPVMYAIFVLDFKILKWETDEGEAGCSGRAAPAAPETEFFLGILHDNGKEFCACHLCCVVCCHFAGNSQTRKPDAVCRGAGHSEGIRPGHRPGGGARDAVGSGDRGHGLRRT